MSVIGSALIEIVPDTGGFAAKLNKDVTEAVDETSAKTSGAFGKLAAVGQAALIGIGTAAVGVGTEAVHLADTFEAAHARLEVAVKNSGASYDAFSKQISAADKSNETFGLTADQTEGALARLTQGLNDPKKAIADLGLVVNLAAARHIDLEDAATLVGKVASGNTTILKRYGIDLDVAKGGALALAKAHDAVTKAAQAVAVAQDKAGVSHLNTAAAGEKVAAANDAIMKASLTLQNAQNAEAVIQDKVNTGKVTGTAAAAELAKAHNAVEAASVTVSEKQAALQKAIEGVGDASAKVTAAQGKGADAVAKAQEKLRAAQEKLNAVTGAGGTAIAALSERFGGSAAAQAETFRGKIAGLEAKVKDLGIQLGLVLIPIIEKVVSAIVDASNWFDQHRLVLEIVAGVVGTVLVAAIGAYIATMIVAAATTVAAAAPFIAIAALVAALAAGVIYAYQHWGWFHDAVQKVITIIGEIKVAVSDFMEGFTRGTDEIGSSQTVWARWGAVAYEWFLKVKDAVETAMSAVHTAVTVTLDAVGSVVDAFVNGPLAFITEQIDVFSKWWDAHWSEIRQVVDMVVAAISNGFAVVTSVFQVAYDMLRPMVEVFWQVFQAGWHIAFDTVIGVLRAAWDVIGGIFRSARDLVLGIIGTLLDLLTGHWGKAWDDMRDTVSNVFKDIGDTVFRVLHAAVDTVTNLGGDFLAAGLGIGKALINGIIQGISSLGSDVGSAVGNVIKSIPGGKAAAKVLGFASGGLVPGAVGAPMLAVVHGGEFVLSRDMLTGGVPIGASLAPASATAPVSITFGPISVGDGLTVEQVRNVFTDVAHNEIASVLGGVLDRAAAGAGARHS